MTSTLKPTSVKNLDIYGSEPLEWRRVIERISSEWASQGPDTPDNEPGPHTYWLATVRPDGRPHVTAVGVAWSDGTFYFTSGDGTKNLAEDPHCVITTAAHGIDLVVEGTARKVTEQGTLERLAAVYALSGWSPEVRDGAFTYEYSAPSAGPPPWFLYEFTPETVFGVATEEPYGATRWRVQREAA